jgi:hypothetical protein
VLSLVSVAAAAAEGRRHRRDGTEVHFTDFDEDCLPRTTTTFLNRNRRYKSEKPPHFSASSSLPTVYSGVGSAPLVIGAHLTQQSRGILR